MIDPIHTLIAQEINRCDETSPTTSTEIFAKFNITDQALRSIIHKLRLDGYPIASSPKGYWWAKTPDEIDPTIAHLRGRATKIYEIVRALEKSRAKLAIGQNIEIGKQEELF